MAVYEEIVLAAWLHDIAKFAWRAGIEGSTEEVLQRVKEFLPKRVKDGGPDIQSDVVIRLASACHDQVSYNVGSDEWAIARGNRLSGGKDHDDDDEKKFNEQPLVNIISTLKFRLREAPIKAYCQVLPMEGRAIFPADNPKAGKQEYLNLWQDFERDFRALDRWKNYNEFISAFDTLMERYCWCIPSTTRKDEDVSLYQHSKLTAAFAGTLYLYYKEKTPIETASNQNDEPAFLFIQGDASGIQRYIFDLKSTEDSAKLLRARSFQIWALAEIIAEHLAGRFGVSREHIISSAGGKFILLLPNTQEVIKKLGELRLELEIYFLKEFAGKLSFILSNGVHASALDLLDNTHKLLNAINKSGQEAKQKKMQLALGKDGPGPKLTELYSLLQKNGECKWCETLPAKTKQDKICINCEKLIDIGGELIKTVKIKLDADKLIRFGYMVTLLQKDDKQFGYLTEYEAGSPLMALPYWAPIKDERYNKLYTFEEIADKSTGGLKKLAMFKADIDFLTDVFISAWGSGAENRISLSRYAQLSRYLHYFFSGYVSGFISSRSEYRDKIYTVFSGGDDLCVLGAWDEIMRFAADFRKEFSKFTNNNPSVTLSGGIALANPRLPVRAIAAAAEEALEKSKEREDKKTCVVIKNGVSVFGVTVSWEEYEKSLQDGKDITGYMNSNIASSSVVYKMIDFAKRAEKVNEEEVKPRDLLWMSNYRYTIARNIKLKDKKHEEEHEKVLKFFHGFGCSPEAMVNSRIAVSYALYAQRGDNKEADNG
jgi:CRISPR-associated protein Csm1